MLLLVLVLTPLLLLQSTCSLSFQEFVDMLGVLIDYATLILPRVREESSSSVNVMVYIDIFTKEVWLGSIFSKKRL